MAFFIVSWLIPCLLIVIGSICIIGNWTSLHDVIRSVSATSFVPIVGGLMLFGGLSLWPVSMPDYIPYLAFVADFGCIPWALWVTYSLLANNNNA